MGYSPYSAFLRLLKENTRLRRGPRRPWRAAVARSHWTSVAVAAHNAPSPPPPPPGAVPTGAALSQLSLQSYGWEVGLAAADARLDEACRCDVGVSSSLFGNIRFYVKTFGGRSVFSRSAEKAASLTLSVG